ncbi:PspC family transcriptional regulator [Pseudonocardia saturnea]|uniref:PspC family transcriptional regulator n=1 Tax=Pseudonocardia saturnea TaxID=33909 RepID=A0ABQ0S4M3_9PSEU|nr:PspC family transcriptional regulator [Pseudonocardia autotrophica]GEC27870.1 PspC family transcriptional regulator [Pseudonocardia saturnea]
MQGADTLRDMWESRPLRPRDDRKLAGVAAALARRYELDPTLVRVGFVVATIVGPGLPMYLAGCAVLPDAGRPGGPPPQRGSTSVLAAVLLTIAALLAIPLVMPMDRLIATIVTLALLVGVHVTRGARPGGRAAALTPTPPVPWATPGATTAQLPGQVPGQFPGQPAGAPGAQPGPQAAPVEPARTPPKWDPLGVAPFAWDLPEPGPEPAPPPRPRSKLTPVTLAVALVAAGMVGVVVLAAPGALPPSAVPGAALAVVGIGLLMGAFRRAGRWLIPFAVLLALTTWLATLLNGALGPDGWAVRGGMGPIVDAPVTAAQLAPEYRRGTGSIDLDLTRLDLTATPGADGPVRTRAEVGAGAVTVRVPADADLVVRGSTGWGDVTVDGQSRAGQDARLDVTDPGPDGPGGRVLELDLRAEMGAVEVQRG